MTDRKTTNTDVICASLLIIGIGGLGAWHYSRKLVKAMRTEEWQPVSGEIVQSEMVSASPAMPSKFYAAFLYQYQVNEQVFESDRVSWAKTGPSGLRLYHEGDTVTVYVNPLASHEAVLIQGTNPWTYVQISLCAVFSLLGVWLLVKLNTATSGY